MNLEQVRAALVRSTLRSFVLVAAAGCQTQTTSDGDTQTGSTSTASTGDGPATSVGPASATSTTGAPASTSTDAPPSTDEGPPWSCESAFAIMCDGGGGVSFECDVFAQDCDRGEKCAAWANDGGDSFNATRCVPVPPDAVGVGDACRIEDSVTSGIDDCDATSMCFHADPQTLEGVCVPLCTGIADVPVCELDTQTCGIMNDGSLALCLEQCDPLAQSCAPGMGCYAVNEAFACLVTQANAGQRPGTPCGDDLVGSNVPDITECAPGMLCIRATAIPGCEGEGCCSALCDTNDPLADETCATLIPGAGCENWYTRGFAPEGFENIGVCAQP